jgi:hypothetical protein
MCAGFIKNRMIHKMSDIKLPLMMIFCKLIRRGAICLLTKAYEEEVPTAEAKYNDLKMCNDLTMPIEHNTFYKSLKRSAVVPNVLPQPNALTKPHMEKNLDLLYMLL